MDWLNTTTNDEPVEGFMVVYERAKKVLACSCYYCHPYIWNPYIIRRKQRYRSLHIHIVLVYRQISHHIINPPLFLVFPALVGMFYFFIILFLAFISFIRLFGSGKIAVFYFFIG